MDTATSTTLDLETLFGSSGFRIDLEQGTIFNPGQTRIVYLSTDVVLGIYHALTEEIGPAWRLVFQNSGRTWGAKVARNLDRELGLAGQGQQGAFRVADYLRFAEQYFSFHGWGSMKLDFSAVPTHGVIEATLRDSFFAELLVDEKGTVDLMIAGILQGLLGHVAGRELGCVETACTRRGDPECKFLLSTPARIEALEPLIEQGYPHEELLARLKG